NLEDVASMVNAALSAVVVRSFRLVLRLPVDLGRRVCADIAVADIFAHGLSGALGRRPEAGAATALEPDHVAGLEVTRLDSAHFPAGGGMGVNDPPRGRGPEPAGIALRGEDVVGGAHGEHAVLQHLELARVAQAATMATRARGVAHELERAHPQW